MLTNYERETYFNFNEAEKEAVVFTYNASLIRKLKNATEEHAEINLVKDNPEEERLARASRLRKIWECNHLS